MTSARALLVALGGILSIGVVLLVALRAVALRLLRTRQRPWEPGAAIESLGALPFTIALDDATIRGWRLRPNVAARASVVIAHGWQSHAGAMLPWAKPLVTAGFECLVYDALGHGNSDPAAYTSLRHFRRELAAVVRHARATEPDRDIVLLGHSMGGAAAILVAAEGAPATRALIVAGAPTDPLEITREFFDARGLPGRALVLVLRPFWQRVIGETSATLRPIDAIARVERPVLILHGESDRQVSLRHAEQLAAANPRARLIRFPEGGHNDLPAQAGYAAAVLEFLEWTGGG